MPPESKKLLDQVRETIRLKHYSKKTEKTYVSWIRRFILFHGKRHPEEMGEREIEAFLSHLAVKWITVDGMPAFDVSTTMIYTHVLNRGGLAVRSPLDL